MSNRLFKDAVLAYQIKLHSEHKLTLDTARRLKRLLGAFGDRPLADITQQEWTKFIIEHMGGASPATIQRNLIVMKAVLNHASYMGWRVNRLRGMRNGKASQRNTHLQEDEVVPFVNYIRQKYGVAYGFLALLLIDTGMRFGEAFNLKWYNFGPEWIQVTVGHYSHTKTNARQIPTSPRLLDYMAKYKMYKNEGFDNSLVVSSFIGGSRSTINKTLGIAVKDAALSLGCMCGEDFRVHDLRHTFAYLCALAGADIADIKELLGHYSIDMTMRYRGFVRSRSSKIITGGMRRGSFSGEAGSDKGSSQLCDGNDSVQARVRAAETCD